MSLSQTPMEHHPYSQPRATLETIARTAKQILLKDGIHIPSVIVGGSKQTTFVQIEALASTHEERAYQLYLLGLKLAHSAEVGVLQQVFFISEGWMSVASQDKLPKNPPSQDPKRKEVLMITHRKISPPHTQMVLFEMKRNRQGRLTSVKDFSLDEKTGQTSAQSPLMDALVIGLLKTPRKPHD